MPLLTIASAASRMILSVTWFSHTYQLFQPMCGVRASVSPQTILNLRFALPSWLAARNVTTYSPGFSIRPWIWPVWASTVRPFGRWSTANVIGPVARRRNREQERMPRVDAEDARAVDARRARRLGREDDGLFVRRADNDRTLARDEQLGVGPIRVTEGDVAPLNPRGAAAS